MPSDKVSELTKLGRVIVFPGNHCFVQSDTEMPNLLYSSSFECTNNEFEFSANLGNFLPSGFYFLRINHKNQSQKATFIVD